MRAITCADFAYIAANQVAGHLAADVHGCWAARGKGEAE